jgi:hypothetical protein
MITKFSTDNLFRIEDQKQIKIFLFQRFGRIKRMFVNWDADFFLEQLPSWSKNQDQVSL